MALNNLIGIIAQITGRAPGVDAAFNKVVTGVQKMTGAMKATNVQFQKSGFFLTAMLQRVGFFASQAGRKLIGTFGDMIDVAAQFDKQVIRVGALLGKDGASKEVEILRRSLLALAAEMPTTAVQLAEVATEITQLGLLRASDDVEEFRLKLESLTATTVKLALVSRDLSDPRAAQIVGALASQFGIAELEGAEFELRLKTLVSQMAKVQAITGGTTDEIFRVTQRFAIMGQTAGLSAAEILALAGATQNLRITQQKAGTALNKLIIGLSKNLPQLGSILGLTAEQLEAMTSSGKGTSLALRGFLGRIRELGKAKNLKGAAAVAQALDDFGLSANRSTEVAAGLAKILPRVTEVMEELDKVAIDASKGIFFLDVAFQNMRQNLEAAIKEFRGAIQSFQIALIEPLIPALIGILRAIRQIFTLLLELPAPIRAVLGLTVLVGGAALVFLGTMTVIASIVGTVILLFRALQKEIGIAGVAALGLEGTLTKTQFLLLPFTGIGKAIGTGFKRLTKGLTRPSTVAKITREGVTGLVETTTVGATRGGLRAATGARLGGKAVKGTISPGALVQPGLFTPVGGAVIGRTGERIKKTFGRGGLVSKAFTVSTNKVNAFGFVLSDLAIRMTGFGIPLNNSVSKTSNALTALAAGPLKGLEFVIAGIGRILTTKFAFFAILAIALFAVFKAGGKELKEVFALIGAEFKEAFAVLKGPILELISAFGLIFKQIGAVLAPAIIFILKIGVLPIIDALLEVFAVIAPIIEIVARLLKLFAPLIAAVAIVFLAIKAAPILIVIAALRVLAVVLKPILEFIAVVFNGISSLFDLIGLGTDKATEKMKGFAGATDEAAKAAGRLGGATEGGKLRLITGDITGAVSATPTEVQPFQSGGVVNAPTLGLVGEGNEPEVIAPLSVLPEILASISTTGGGSIGPIEITVPISIDGEEIARRTVRISEDEIMRRFGRAPQARLTGTI